jgi:hypothetical protein
MNQNIAAVELTSSEEMEEHQGRRDAFWKEQHMNLEPYGF